MIQPLAIAILLASTLWLLTVAYLMVFRPALCLRLMARMAATQRSNLIEQVLRIVAGLALLARAPFSKTPQLFEIGGWLLFATSALLIVMPLRWHTSYAIFWAQRLNPVVVRFLAPVPVGMGAVIAYASL